MSHPLHARFLVMLPRIEKHAEIYQSNWTFESVVGLNSNPSHEVASPHAAGDGTAM